MANEVKSPYAQFFDPEGVPVSGGRLFIGVAGTDPTQTANQLPVFWDSGATLAASQPLNVLGGYIVRIAAPGRVYLPSSVADYSLKLVDKDNSQIFYIASVLNQSTGTIDTGGTAAAALSYKQSFVGAVERTIENRLREKVSPKDAGADGSGVHDDGPAIGTVFSQAKHIHFPAGSVFRNSTQSLSLPFGSVAEFEAGSSITSASSGAVAFKGVTIRKGNNPAGVTGWTNASEFPSGLSVDFGGYGAPAAAGPSAIIGSINVPFESSIIGAAAGVSAYAKTSSASTKAHALISKAEAGNSGVFLAAGVFEVNDAGHSTSGMVGAAIGMNSSVAGSYVVGLNIEGASTAAPSLGSAAVRVGPVGVYQNPMIPWQTAYLTDDGAAVCALSVGAIKNPNQLLSGSGSASQSINFWAYDKGNNRIGTGYMASDINGDFLFTAGASGRVMALRPLASQVNIIQMRGDGLGFFNQVPAIKQQVTGAKAGNQALISLIRALSTYGFIQDATT